MQRAHVLFEFLRFLMPSSASVQYKEKYYGNLLLNYDQKFETVLIVYVINVLKEKKNLIDLELNISSV